MRSAQIGTVAATATTPPTATRIRDGNSPDALAELRSTHARRAALTHVAALGNALNRYGVPLYAFLARRECWQHRRPQRPVYRHANRDACRYIDPEFRGLELGANTTSMFDLLKSEDCDVETHGRYREAPERPGTFDGIGRWPWTARRHRPAPVITEPVAGQVIAMPCPEERPEVPWRYPGPRPNRRRQAKEPRPNAVDEAHHGRTRRHTSVTDSRPVGTDDFGSGSRTLILWKRVANGLRACGRRAAHHEDRSGEHHPCD